MTEQNDALTDLRDKAIRNQHDMTPWRTTDDTLLTQCRNCRAVIYRISGAYGGTAHVLQCATVAYNYVPLDTKHAPDETTPDETTDYVSPRRAVKGSLASFARSIRRDTLGYSTGDDNGAMCVNCGRGSTLVGRQCYDCGYTIPRAYTITEHAPPDYIVFHDTHETTQYRITEHVYMPDTNDMYTDENDGREKYVKLTYSTRETIRAVVRSEHGQKYQYHRTVKKPYIAPCGAPVEYRHIYILDNDDGDTLSVVYRYPCRDKCTHRKHGQ